MEVSLILTVALAAAIIVIVLALVAVIVFQRWRINDSNAHLKEFIDENMELRRKIRQTRLLFMLTVLLTFAQGAWADKPMATITTAPTPVTGLTYTGNAQTLINTGTASGGTMQYSLDGSSWSTSLPTGINWGTYTVYYKVVGDASHADNPGGTRWSSM